MTEGSARLVAMAWDDLERWGDVKIIKRFDQGIVNDVRLVELNGSTVVARQGRRSATSLQWEADLLAYLDSNGLSVPNFIPTTDGVTHTNGLVVMRYVEGRMPESDKDWQLVVDYLTQLHALTGKFAQRPGFASSSELADADMTMTILDMHVIPDEVKQVMRVAWKRVAQQPRSVVHGDPSPSNIRISQDGTVTLIDWDEARIDISGLDFGGLAWGEDHVKKWSSEAERHAFSAWDAAVCWDLAPEHAQKRIKALVDAGVR